MSEPFIAEVRLFAGTFAPRGWADCNGQLLPINQNQALFALLGTTYGGDGRVTFALPNLQGRAAIHAGQGPGLTNRNLGETGGAATSTLTTAQIPAHHHALRGTSPATTGTPGPTVALAETSGGAKVYRPAGNLVAMGAPLANAGGGQPHENRQPYLGMRYIIALQGVFPSRN